MAGCESNLQTAALQDSQPQPVVGFLGFENPLAFARRSRVLLMRHVESEIDIDVIFGGLLFEQAAIDNSKIHDIGGLRVRLLRVITFSPLLLPATAATPHRAKFDSSKKTGLVWQRSVTDRSNHLQPGRSLLQPPLAWHPRSCFS
jgi:hypothetical protein